VAQDTKNDSTHTLTPKVLSLKTNSYTRTLPISWIWLKAIAAWAWLVPFMDSTTMELEVISLDGQTGPNASRALRLLNTTLENYYGSDVWNSR